MEESADFRVIIAGSRDITSLERVVQAMADSGFVPTVVLSGDARGVDRLGTAWATERGIPVEHYPADWDTHGKRAGFLRNEEMAGKADGLVAVWDGKSRGTKHMIDLARAQGLKVFVALNTEVKE